jgi:hypothetical protein
MRTLKKILLGLTIAIGIILIATAIYINYALPTLPQNTNAIIDAVIQNPLPDKSLENRAIRNRGMSGFGMR